MTRTDLLNELLQDCLLYGLDYECFAYYDRQSENFVDYSLEKETVLHFNEIVEKQPLFKTFMIVVSDDLIRRGIYSAGACFLVACRNLAQLSQSAFASKLDIPLKTYHKYEYGTRAVSLDLLLKVRSAMGVTVSFETFFTTYEELSMFLKNLKTK